MASANDGVADSNTFITIFKSIGLSQSKAAEAAKNPKSAAVLKNLIDKHELAKSTDGQEKQAGLIAALAVHIAKSVDLDQDEQDYMVHSILKGNLKSVDQVTGAMQFLSSRYGHR
jgi:glutaminyl-tRNA synthetase